MWATPRKRSSKFHPCWTLQDWSCELSSFHGRLCYQESLRRWTMVQRIIRRAGLPWRRGFARSRRTRYQKASSAVYLGTTGRTHFLMVFEPKASFFLLQKAQSMNQCILCTESHLPLFYLAVLQFCRRAGSRRQSIACSQVPSEFFLTAPRLTLL